MTQYASPMQWLTVEGKKMGRFGWFEKSEEVSGRILMLLS
jgi:hypothetical protein